MTTQCFPTFLAGDLGRGQQRRFQGPFCSQHVPHRPHSFVSGLCCFPSCGKTAMHSAVDHFSKMAHFVAFPKPPLSKDTAQLLLHRVFCPRGIPIWSPTNVPGWRQSLGGNSVGSLSSRSVFPLVSLPSPAVKLNAKTRTGKQFPYNPSSWSQLPSDCQPVCLVTSSTQPLSISRAGRRKAYMSKS